MESALKLSTWRISKAGHGATCPNGTGAHRWNSPDAPIIYAAQSRALAVLEMLGHLERGEVFEPYVLIEIGMEDSLVETIDVTALPGNWRADPPPDELKRIGDDWMKKAQTPVLRAPSALLPEEYNYLLNTKHPEFARLSFGAPVPFRFDPSFIKEGQH